jgi:hypothetical protein
MTIIFLRNGQLFYMHMSMTARKQKVIAFTNMKDSLKTRSNPTATALFLSTAI